MFWCCCVYTYVNSFIFKYERKRCQTRSFQTQDRTTPCTYLVNMRFTSVFWRSRKHKQTGQLPGPQPCMCQCDTWPYLLWPFLQRRGEKRKRQVSHTRNKAQTVTHAWTRSDTKQKLESIRAHRTVHRIETAAGFQHLKKRVFCLLNEILIICTK